MAIGSKWNRAAQRGLGMATAVSALTAGLALAGGPALATEGAAAGTYVVPPGGEAILEAMLCKGPLADDCACGPVSIQGGIVDAQYTCPKAQDVHIQLGHAGLWQDAPVKTAKFSLKASAGAPDALLKAVESAVRAQEAAWEWTVAVPAVANAEASTPSAGGAAWTPDSRVAYAKGAELLRSGQAAKALEVLIRLARDTPKPRPGVLGHLVSALASTAPTEADVERYMRSADAQPSDLLAQFLAGVSAHYCGHRNEPTRAGKQKMYELALRYLARTLPAYQDEPRAHIYLAVSHYRLGHQADAEREIEAAVALGDADADAFYCRAEIWHKKDPKRALLDIQKYLDITEPSGAKRADSFVSDSKQQRVHAMQDMLRNLKPGETPPDDMFDPIVVERAQAGGDAARWFAPAVAALAVLGGTLAWLWRRKQSPAG